MLTPATSTRAILVASIAAATSALCDAPAASGAAGALDPSFGRGGVVTHRAGVSRAMAIQADGRIVTVGNGLERKSIAFELRRYRADGSVDTSFSRDGRVTTVFARSPDCGGAPALALQANGKIVAVGRSGCTHGRFAVARYLRDGRLDRSFSGDGKATTSFGSRCRFSQADAVAFQRDGKVVAAGRSGCTRDGRLTVRFALARYTRRGRLDRTFGGDGRVSTDFTPGWDAAYDMLVDRAGRIVVAGAADEDGMRDEIAIARYRRDGKLDGSFGAQGKITMDLSGEHDCSSLMGRALVEQRDGKLVAGGTAGCGSAVMALVRYTARGRLDPSFDGNGKVATDFPEGESCLLPTLSDLAIQADGKLLAGGNAGCKDPHPVFALARFRTDGLLDTTFGGDGMVTKRLCPDSGKKIDQDIEHIDALALQRGRILAAGFSCPGFTLLRYLQR